MKGKLITLLLLHVLLLCRPVAAQEEEEYDSEPLGQSTIYIYEHGCLVGYSVGEDFEFYEVEDRDIQQGNAELLAELQSSDNAVTLGASVAAGGDRTFNAEQGGAHPEGLMARDLRYHDALGPDSWQELYADWSSPKAHSGQYDYSSASVNLDASFFNLGGYAYGIHSTEANDAQSYAAGHKSRRMGRAIWRSGSADGGSWVIEGQAYKVNTDQTLAQVADVDLKRVDAKFRLVECGLLIKGGAFYGQYESDFVNSDNAFVGGRLESEYCLAPDLRLSARADLDRISADRQSATLTQSDLSGGLTWDLSNAVTLVGEARLHDESNDLAANTHLTGFDDLGARLEIHPTADAKLSLGWRRRSTELERLHFGNTDVGLLSLEKANPPSRADLAEYREPDSARGELLSAKGQWRLNDRLYLGAYWDREEFDSLPAAETLFNPEPKAPYFGTARSSSSLHMNYDTGCGGNLTLRSDAWSRSNGVRESRFRHQRFSLGYNAPLNGCTRWGAEVSRSSSNLELAGDIQDWDASSWNYGLNLAGFECWADYRLSFNHQTSTGLAGGEYDSLGLELNFKDSPLQLTGWWRERRDALGGFADYDDTGVSIGYRVEL